MAEKEAIQNLVRRFPTFESRRISEQLPLIAWFLHHVCQQNYFTEQDIRRCLKHLDIKPAFSLLARHIRVCPHLVKADAFTTAPAYKLHWRTRDEFDKQILPSSRSIKIHQLLKDLPAKIPIAEEKTFLDETILCYRYGANRAAIVMCWNLAFSHLCNFILKDPSHLTSFNQALASKFPKDKAINTVDDLSRFKEFQVLEVCYLAKLINKNQYKILTGKLDTRNMAAHPSTVKFTQVDVEHYILDLINNVVLVL